MLKRLVNRLVMCSQIKLLFLSCCLVFVVGCGAQRAVYGIPASEWEQLSESEQQAVKQRFEQQEQRYADMREQAEQARQSVGLLPDRK